MNRRDVMTAMVAGSALLAAKGFSQDTANVPVRRNKIAIAEQKAKQIMLLMDTDKDGRISKYEWMNFISKEFDRLDTDHNGHINQKDLLATEIRIRSVSTETLGK